MATLRDLKIFVIVATCGSMTRAAEELYISQPSVSQAIQNLEDEYGVKLFDRIARRIYLTEKGKIMLPYARQIIADIDTMEEVMAKNKGLPIVRIGASVTVGTVYMNSIVEALEKEVPGIDVRITIDNTANIEQMVVKCELDFAIVEGSLTSSDIDYHVLCDDELKLVVGKTHPYYNLESVSLDMLQGQALISRENGSMDRNQFEQFMIENHIQMQKKWCCTNTESIKNAVIAGHGIAILSEKLIRDEVESGQLKMLEVEGVCILRSFKYIVHKNRKLQDNICSFIEQKMSEGWDVLPMDSVSRTK